MKKLYISVKSRKPGQDFVIDQSRCLMKVVINVSAKLLFILIIHDPVKSAS